MDHRSAGQEGRGAVTGPLACLAVCALALPAQASCIAISFGLDVSGSVNGTERQQMRQGLAAALTRPEIIEQFGAGAYSLQIFEYADAQSIVVDWTMINGPADLEAAAAAVLSQGVGGAGTQTGEAMLFGLNQFGRSGCGEIRLNIVSDGDSPTGTPPHFVRQQFEADWRYGVNAIAIGPMGAGFLEANVVFGSGAFVEVATGFDAFEEAVSRKLGRELVGM